ncbi:hypothetical protein DFH08DRAFT_954542 [Mycena albidolilacea]|uniref:Uncharacterized protein n=1 Tax=Mycena albidolilacea TaxID=1033008 RepID=A0AAD7AFP9_9AGAR|nr:hypothetical protein DFH08DRAFT_954542 [Mycena albidolilacea]
MSNQQREALAANWDPEILAAYMAKVQREDDDEDEAMSSGDSDDSDVEFEGDTSISSESTALSDMELAHPDDIASNDSAFSSEDEFAEESITEKQTMRRELVLARPTPEILHMRQTELAQMHIAYMKQLDDADEEIAEITGVPYEAVVRRQPVSGYDEPLEQGDDVEGFVMELRKRSNKEVHSTESKKAMVEQLVLLAQALFRKERQIKHLQG